MVEDESEVIEDWDVSTETRSARVERLVRNVVKELKIASKGNYSSERAEKSAALAIEIQFEIAEFIEDSELYAKRKKLEAESTEGTTLINIKNNAGNKKPTDAVLKASVASDANVKKSKDEQYEAEAKFNKFKSFLGSTKDAHYYFRGIAKGKYEV